MIYLYQRTLFGGCLCLSAHLHQKSANIHSSLLESSEFSDCDIFDRLEDRTKMANAWRESVTCHTRHAQKLVEPRSLWVKNTSSEKKRALGSRISQFGTISWFLRSWTVLRLWNNNLYDTCISKFVNPSSAGDWVWKLETWHLCLIGHSVSLCIFRFDHISCQDL